MAPAAIARGQRPRRRPRRDGARAQGDGHGGRRRHGDGREHGHHLHPGDHRRRRGEHDERVGQRAPAADEQRAARPRDRQQAGEHAGDAEDSGRHDHEGSRAEQEPPAPAGELRHPLRVVEVAALQPPLQRQREWQGEHQPTLDDPAAEARGQRRGPARDRDDGDDEGRPGQQAGLVRRWAPAAARRSAAARAAASRHQLARGGQRALRRDAGPRLEDDGGLEHVLRRAPEPCLDDQLTVGRFERAGGHAARPIRAGGAATGSATACSRSR